MVRAGDVVADRLGRVAAEKDRAGMAHPGCQPVRLGDRQLDMFRRDPVDQSDPLVQVVDDDRGAMGPPAGAGDIGARQGSELVGDGADHGIGEVGVVGDQDRLRRLVVLGLGQQVGGDPGRIVVAVGQHQDFRRPGDQVDADPAEDPTLGGRHIGIAGPDDLVHRRDRRRAVGQRADRLGAAEAVDLVDAGKLGGGQHQRVDHAVRRRHRHDQTVDAGNPRRHRVHQHRRGIGRAPARHVDPDRLDRRPPAAELDAGVIDVALLGRHLAAMEGLDPPVGETERVELGGFAGGGRALDLGPVEANRFRHQCDPVEAPGIFQHRLVAAPFDVIQDLDDPCLDILFRLALCRQQALEVALEIGLAQVQSPCHRRPPLAVGAAAAQNRPRNPLHRIFQSLSSIAWSGRRGVGHGRPISSRVQSTHSAASLSLAPPANIRTISAASFAPAALSMVKSSST